jgi:hypothetical protein
MVLKNKKTRLFFSCTLLLLSFVFLFNSARESFHLVLEHDNEIHGSCTEDTEKDDCHLFIVHHIKSDNCSGDHQHFLKKENTCFKCEYYKGKQTFSATALKGSLIVAKSQKPIFIYDQKDLASFSSHQFLRGPPCFM